jgi:hypothetical protein
MKLTKAQRHEYYKRALEDLKAEIEMGRFCLCICPNLGEYIKNHNALVLMSAFPEFFDKKPNNADLEEEWWPYNDGESRIEVLELCVRETAPKKRKTR